MVFVIEDSAVYMMGAFNLMTWMIQSKDQVQAVFPTGGGVPWRDPGLEATGIWRMSVEA